jgi:hypothetical protein
MVTEPPGAGVVQAESVKNESAPAGVTEMATLVFDGTLRGLPKLSCDCTVSTDEHRPATGERGALTKTSRVAAEVGATETVWVVGLTEADWAVTATWDAAVPFTKKLPRLPPLAMVRPVIGVVQAASLKKENPEAGDAESDTVRAEVWGAGFANRSCTRTSSRGEQAPTVTASGGVAKASAASAAGVTVSVCAAPVSPVAAADTLTLTLPAAVPSK